MVIRLRHLAFVERQCCGLVPLPTPEGGGTGFFVTGFFAGGFFAGFVAGAFTARFAGAAGLSLLVAADRGFALLAPSFSDDGLAIGGRK